MIVFDNETALWSSGIQSGEVGELFCELLNWLEKKPDLCPTHTIEEFHLWTIAHIHQKTVVGNVNFT